jgi:hypothetical protein
LVKVCGAGTLAVTLGACTELARLGSKPDATSASPVVAAEPEPTPVVEQIESEPPKPSKLYEWNADGRPVSRIEIDTDAQRARFFAGDEEIGWSTVASGLPKHPTPTGQFSVIEKVENKRSNLYGKVVKNGKVIKSSAKAGRDPIPAGASFEGAHMPYFMRLTHDGIGLHAGPIPRPGQPASHGCIRLPSTLAPVLFKHVSHGTQVEIVGSGPSYGNYIEKQRIAAAQQARVAREAEERRAAEQAAASAVAQDAARGGHGAEVRTAQPRLTRDPWTGALVEVSAPATSAPAPATAVSADSTPSAPASQPASATPAERHDGTRSEPATPTGAEVTATTVSDTPEPAVSARDAAGADVPASPTPPATAERVDPPTGLQDTGGSAAAAASPAAQSAGVMSATPVAPPPSITPAPALAEASEAPAAQAPSAEPAAPPAAVEAPALQRMPAQVEAPAPPPPAPPVDAPSAATQPAAAAPVQVQRAVEPSPVGGEG